jgi:hypothetical protein
LLGDVETGTGIYLVVPKFRTALNYTSTPSIHLDIMMPGHKDNFISVSVDLPVQEVNKAVHQILTVLNLP